MKVDSPTGRALEVPISNVLPYSRVRRPSGQAMTEGGTAGDEECQSASRRRQSRLSAARRLGARDVGGDGQPGAVAARPDVRVATGGDLTVWPRIRGARVDDREIAHETDIDVVGLE